MKSATFSLLLFFGLGICALGQSSDQQALILQKCVDLPELQEFYPSNPDGSKKELHILQHGVSFPTDIAVRKFGKPLVFNVKQEIHNPPFPAYFLFREFVIEEDVARIDFAYYPEPAQNPEAVILINLKMTKSGGAWVIENSQIERR